jgi:ATP-dependent Lon protease
VLNNKINNNYDYGNVISIVGPPGVGKTAIISCVSKIMNIPVSFIPMGGIKDHHYLNGS